MFQPFYGTLLANLTMVENAQFPTMATDGRSIHYNPDFVKAQSDDEVLFTVAHEAAHCANKHHLRRGTRDPRLWNEATDYVINGDLLKAGFGKMPKGGLYDKKYDGMSAEDVYAILAHKKEAEQPDEEQLVQGRPGQGDSDDEGDGAEGQDADQEGQESGQGGQDDEGGQDTGQEGQGAEGGQEGPEGDVGTEGGQDTGQGPEGATEAPGRSQGQGQGTPGQGTPGQGTSGDPGGCGEVIDCPGDAAEIAEENQHWDTVVRQAVNVATRDAGSVPGHLQRLVNELGKPATNWRETLRRFVEQSNRFDYSWQRADRRFATADYIMPGTVSDGVNHIVVVSDTSGSLYCEKAQKRFATEIQSLLDEQVVDKITMIDCDASINNVQAFESGDIVKFTNRGGGGTSFKPVWEWLKTNQEDTACVVYFTDLEPCDGFGTEPALPVMWAAYASSYDTPQKLRERISVVPFGECIEIAE